MYVWFADAKTSVAAPCVIWVFSTCDPAKLKVTVTPGLAASKFFPISVNEPVREEAAKTVSVRGAAVAAGGTGVSVGGKGVSVGRTAVGTGKGVEAGPQAASSSTTAIKKIQKRLIFSP
jgi:hypothetical protein